MRYSRPAVRCSTMSGRSWRTVVVMAAALAPMLPVTGASAQVVAVTVTPSVADPGGTVRVAGSFGFFCAEIVVDLDGVVVARVGGPAGVADGAYDAAFAVP